MKTFQYIIFSLCVLLLTGCSTTGTANFQTIKSYKEFVVEKDIKNLNLNVTYFNKEELQQKCTLLLGVRRTDYLACAGTTVATGNRCFVYSIRPNDFNDHAFLAVLGHEILHCLGAKHE